MAEKREGLKTLFKDAQVPTPGMEGDWGGTKNGDTSFHGATKGTSGKIPETTFIPLPGAPGPNTKATVGSEIANKKEKE